ncbi:MULTISPECIES: hypothetical protein [Enterobacter]|uniref:hypothetical protein n=1 Tax=Enterobacter TaxID=547 RepID=UPI0021C8AF32|nr:hypothetical protein [Enterobacter mori]HDC4609888.1 hypothetical protein [Enterobacter kobei]MCU3988083.1 hypothetical protein [Enterobacter mori]HDC4625503.1 hypothetical protein [Enterobacter kobei]HDR2346410.1 hypothetical protein [Enterobacter kobei]HDR2360814.1 hypothetical protein [Enterobacter kobei]
MSIPESNFDNAMLPETYSQADAEWIKQQLLSLAPTARQKAIQRYAAVYQETFEAEPVSFRKENRARHEANTRLRLFVRNQGRALQGYTAEPPLAGTQSRSSLFRV